ncbi:MAG TPA: glycosyltransferase family 39 protein [Xanthomonadaceae bacterium]|nr:glycosyltransferase family 39 protein [Xanthomonadaceae bacterium]
MVATGILVALLVASSLLLRPLTPVDETRYLSVAWEMWQRGDWVLPYLNGEPYDHKPPLLFWIVGLGWKLFGVNEWWPRLIPALSALAVAIGLARLGERLWPGRPGIGGMTALLFLGTWFVGVFLTAVMFDLLLLAFVVWGWWAFWLAVHEGRCRHWLGLGLALGLGLLTKGPVAALYLAAPLPAMLQWRSHGTMRISGRCAALALLIAVAVPAAWLVLLMAGGHGDLLGHLLIGQTVERVAGEMGHPRPWYWYGMVLPLLLLPWVLWPPLWRSLRAATGWLHEPGTRFVLTSAAVTLVGLSLVAGKQTHYLLPLLSLAALLMARMLVEYPQSHAHFDELGIALAMLVPLPVLFLAVNAGWLPLPAWFDVRRLAGALVFVPLAMALMLYPGRHIAATAARIACSGLLFCILLIALVSGMARPAYDLHAIARLAAAQQREGRALAWVGHYEGQLNFLGRMRAPPEAVEPQHLPEWIARHPDGVIIIRDKRLGDLASLSILFEQPYRSGTLFMLALTPTAQDPPAQVHRLPAS